MKIINIIFKIIICLLVIVAISVLAIRAAGFTPYRIVTDSMVPEINIGDIVFAKSVDVSSIDIGDTIVYISPENRFVAHQVVRIETDEKQFRTKGIANEYEDILPVYFENVAGKVFFKIPLIGKWFGVINVGKN